MKKEAHTGAERNSCDIVQKLLIELLSMPLGWLCGGFEEPHGLSEAQMNQTLL